MSDESNQEVTELKELILANQEKNNRFSSQKFIVWIQAMVGLLVLVISLGINWGISKTKIEVLESDMKNNKTFISERIEKSEEDIRELQLKQAGDDQIMISIEKNLEEIKQKVNKLAEGNNR